ncbi:MAG: hypothetical protein IV088_07530 [Hydrogenophaga sp.]|uniref:hypothetical protein n=1 Tax=Hydrogenophaga sp. TaxID=1904254 RepID=UPI0025BF0C8A|nr:hypothetical protein [Hydrogenophaga sp.]MBT9550681.1 hypothetical protein [Hydrogenophaga sp.]
MSCALNVAAATVQGRLSFRRPRKFTINVSFYFKNDKNNKYIKKNRWTHVLEETNAVAGVSGDRVALLAPPVQRCLHRSGLIK